MRERKQCMTGGIESNHIYLSFSPDEVFTRILLFLQEKGITHYVSQNRYRIKAMLYSDLDYCECRIELFLENCIHLDFIVGSRDLFWREMKELYSRLGIQATGCSRPPLYLSRSLSTNKTEQIQTWNHICENMAMDQCRQDLQYQYVQTLVSLAPSLSLDHLSLDVSIVVLKKLILSSDPQTVRLVCKILQTFVFSDSERTALYSLLRTKHNQWTTEYTTERTRFRIQFTLRVMEETIAKLQG